MKRQLILFLFMLCTAGVFAQQNTRWTEAQANAWYARQPWLVGTNYTPAYAINQLEFWQEETFDLKAIEKELAWAEALGMNTQRVFLHDLLYKQDKEGLFGRMDAFLSLCKIHHIKPLFVLFDSCWDPAPKLGKQNAPKPHTHNSGWLQSPGIAALQNPAEYARLEDYVKGVVGHFKNDKRILGWDIWNEPEHSSRKLFPVEDLSEKAKLDLVLPLLEQSFAWARSASPSQPLTAAIWQDSNWSVRDSLTTCQKLMLDNSDIITFHNYRGGDKFEMRVKWLQQYNRPIICTEYMARNTGSTFEAVLPIAKKYKVGAINWGFVAGKTQTNYPWQSWSGQFTAEPKLWFHDILRPDGTAFDAKETDLIKQLTKAN
ncbi:cellulase family glycosylhydrolase [Pedobacter sp. MC2016-24]|uniref:cellulase family glycosylhydrolase n=1 Tax=Pedobacter sp. MC2016-24 TaxID=2780090 RepID=UPI00187E1804|nr:cellulase family glycosylhydrolase [Pedobacter sp. MC2016-24]MBE9600298.1 cellulase family glycosylhydrolase [Pedobacter sp. MC2016-24]